MKRSEIKAGTVYAYQAGMYDHPRPVLVVEVAYWRRTGRSYGEPEGSKPTFRSHAAIAEEARQSGRDYKPEDRFGGHHQRGDCGLLGLDFEHSGNRGFSAPKIEDLNGYAAKLTNLVKSFTLPAIVEKIAAMPRPTARFEKPKGLEVILLNPSWIRGEWAETVDARLSENERRSNVEDNLKAESDDRVSRAQKRVEALRALGLPGEIADAQEEAHRSWRSTSQWDKWAPPVYRGNTERVVLSMRQIDALLTLIPDGAQWREEDVEEDGWTLRKPEYEDGDDALDEDDDVAESDG